jgi:hypothetical protein
MTCNQFTDALPDVLERTADDATRVRAEAHAAECAECGALLADLRQLSVDAAALPELAPSRDLWSGIAARIETPVVEIVPGGTVERWNGGTLERRRRLAPVWLGLAAAALVGITATVTHQLTKQATQAVPPLVASKPVTPADTPKTVQLPSAPDTVHPLNRSTVPPSVALASNKPSAESTYDTEIARLRVIVAGRRSSLDTATVGVIERNLKVIDDAIAQCRAALRRDPASQFLMESLNDALDTKIHLLRTAATLPSRS